MVRKSTAFFVVAAFLSSDDALRAVSCFSISSSSSSSSSSLYRSLTTTSYTHSSSTARRRKNHHQQQQHQQQLWYDSSLLTTTTCLCASSSSSSSSSSTTDNAETTTSTTTKCDSSSSSSSIFNTTLVFPPYEKLMALQPGEFVTSEPFTVDEEYDFCVKLYPRGGGHKAQFSVFSGNDKNDDQKLQGKSGFGMSYQQRPLFGGKVDEKVGAYLQYLPRDPQDTTTVDATFSLRLKGQQTQGPKFDVEWKAGMRFVALDESKLAQGQANDFGAHLLRTQLLPEFLGFSSNNGDDDSFGRPVTMQVQVQIHDEPPENNAAVTLNGEGSVKEEPDRSSNGGGSSLSSLLGLKDIRTRSSNDNSDNGDDPVRVGHIVVPVLRRLSQRPKMFRQGIYPGVEYRVLRIINSTTDEDLFYYPKESSKQKGIDYELKPIYPLVAQLERPWPVRVSDADVPKLLSSNQYNLLSAIGSLLTAVTGLLTAFIISQAVSLFFIPSRSMDPTLQVGDVLLVDKVTPRLASLVSGGANAGLGTGDVVLFHPPTKLLDIVQQSGGRITNRDLFVKRIAAQPGDSWTVTKSGDVQINGGQEVPTIRRDLCSAEPLRLIERYIQRQDNVMVEPNQVFVLGDCESVSVDSRVWGPLSNQNIVGRPLLRLWPLSRFGSIGLPAAASAAAAAADVSPIQASEAMSDAPPIVTTTRTMMRADWTD